MNILVFAAAFAASNTVAELPTVFVEASRVGHEPLELAHHVTVMDGEEVRATEAKSLPEVLAHCASLDVWHPGAENPILAQITMRGYGENGFGRTLVMVDGENLANPDMAAPNCARVPVNGIERIEILHGPQTVLYGDGASAGMINIVTDRGADYSSKSYGEVHGGSYGAVGVAAGTRGGSETNGVTWRADAGYDRSDGWRDNSGYGLWNATGAVRQDFSGGSYLRLSAFFSDADFDLPGPLSERDAAVSPRRSTYSDHGRITAWGVGLSGRGVIDAENELEFALTFSQRAADFSNRDYTDVYGMLNRYRRDYESDIYSIRFAPQYCNRAELFARRNEFLFGLEAKYALLHGDSLTAYPDYGLETSERYDISRLTGGVFARDEFFVFDELSVLAGARLERDWNRNNVAENGGRADNFAAGEAALNYRPAENAKVFARWCSFYRNPFIDEYRWSSGAATETAKPERGWVAELGGRWDATEELYFSGTLYYGETRNEIHYNPFAMSNENSPWLHRRQGVELAGGWEREGTAAVRIGWTGTSSTKAEGKYKGNWVPAVPRQMLTCEGRVWVWDEFDVFAGYRLIGSRYAISDTPNANGRLRAESVFRLGCRYRPTWRYLEGLTFSFSCENLFDRDYCDYAVASVTSGANAYYPACGRSFLFTLRYEF